MASTLSVQSRFAAGFPHGQGPDQRTPLRFLAFFSETRRKSCYFNAIIITQEPLSPSMSDILEKIIRYKTEEVATAKLALPLQVLAEYARSAGPVRPFRIALEERIKSCRPALIAEIKKASPSRGLIREDFDPPALAKAYDSGGAACLSILTDKPSFHGTPENLKQARTAVDLPVLRKDFMIDTYQVVQARAWGADCILIILAEIDDHVARDLAAAASNWGMDAIVEVHDDGELDRALKLDCNLIGINNRNLKTFETTLQTTERLAPRVPRDRIVISESGISTAADIARLQRVGVNTFLVGESLMRQSDVEAATRRLLGGTGS